MLAIAKANNDLTKMVDGRPIRAAAFDIESTALEAGNGYMLCACIKEIRPDNLNGKTHTFRIDDYAGGRAKFSDKDLVADVNKCLDSFDLIVGWYSSRFDFPFVNTRSLKHRIMPPRKNYRRDLCLCARSFGKLRNNRLATWDKYLHDGKTEKTFLDFDVWIQAMRGDKKSLNYIVTHCEADVLVTEKVYKRVMPLLGKLRRN